MEAIRKILKSLFPSQWVEENSGESMVTQTRLHFSENDRIRQIIRAEMFRRAIDASAETFEEADDFELDDDTEWVSDHEEQFDPPSVTIPTSPAAAANPPPASPPAVPPSDGA